MKKLLFILLTLVIIIFNGCTTKITGDEKTAEDLVKSKGYIITNRIGQIQKYILKKNKLYGGAESMLYQQTWGVQTVEPDNYFGKEITVYGFTVKNHPMQKEDRNAKDGVNVYVMLSEGNIIGGYSYPNADVVGSFNSIDGKTLEEVTGLSFQQWQDNWRKKYGS